MKFNLELTKSLFVLAIVSLLCGVCLRFFSFGWNKPINGDVNLFVLTAREFVQNNRLFYPLKWEYSDNVEYVTFSSPSTQHPPLWPFLGGVVGKIFQIDDTFFVLKILTELIGISLLLVIVCTIFYTKWVNEVLVVICFMSLSPLLVDFSANASSYILSTFTIILANILMINFKPEQRYHYISAGVLCGIAFQIHSILIGLPLSFLIFWSWKKTLLKNTRNISMFFVAFLVILTPWIVWNLYYFGKPFYSYSSYFLLKNLGLMHVGIYDDIITARIVDNINIVFVIQKYVELFIIALRSFVIVYILSELSVFGSVLFVIGLIKLIRYEKELAISLLLPNFAYIIVMLLWVTFKYRFLVPILPIGYIVAAFGFTELYQKRGIPRFISKVCLLGFIAWIALGFFDQPEPTRYYMEDSERTENYIKMQSLALKLKEIREPDVIFGYTLIDDSDLEAVYWHRFPSVAKWYQRQGGYKTEELQKIAEDFDVRYIWTDSETVSEIQTTFPSTEIILHNNRYYIVELNNSLP